ncbi:vWA domain-containing protein [Sphingomonas sp. ASY06-1R]|uniref:vWA domain-containing protein n=1 Tax=Sphingomonas sp. ASY06-1R TaxID=3445771 RepID=UPI003FA2CA0D
MTFSLLRNVTCCLLALAAGGCGKPSSDRQAASDRDRAAMETSVQGATDAARAYVAQFTQKDPEACFKKDVVLKQPALRARAGELGPQVPPTRVIVMIDGSGSMAGRMGAKTKLELAREAARSFVDGLPPSVQTSLLVFGQQGNNSEAGKAKSCAAVDIMAPMSQDRAGYRSALGQVRAIGWTPLAAALDRAEGLLAASSTPGEQIIYVVSDGEETCGGDPVAAAKRINAGRTRAIVNVIGFKLPGGEAAKLAAVARAGGGGFVNLSNEAELARYDAKIREEIRQTDNEVATSIANTDNKVATSIAITNAQTCTSILATNEETAMSIDLTDRETAGKPVPFREAAKALLKARHDAMRARFEAYRARLSGAEARAKTGIDAAANAVR